ncbi:hypothetical protein G6702_01735 [Polynucleobacter paneuropaeus]|nr:hypothetical protein G6702_01735 [Polynucleobacter paneuropaeus]
MSNYATPKLIYVWIGDVLPSWAKIALRMSNELCGVQTVLLCNRVIGVVDEVAETIFLEDFYIRPEGLYKRFKSEALGFRNEFWLKTTERFFVLQQYCAVTKQRAIFHAEIDNLVFDISDLAKKLDQQGSGFFCPRDAPKRGIASLIYINKIDALFEMTEYYLSSANKGMNDMNLLGEMLTNSRSFFSLPTEGIFNLINSENWVVLDWQACGGIFDAAAIGQYIFGVDGRNINGVLFNGFINENAGYKINELHLIKSNSQKIFKIKSEDKECILYNLHIHSKIFDKLNNDKYFNYIIGRLNKNKKNIISMNMRNWNILSFLKNICININKKEI